MASTMENDTYVYCLSDGKLTREKKENGSIEIVAQNSKATEISWKFSGILYFVGFIVLFIYDEHKRGKI